MSNGVSLAVLALAGLANGFYTDSGVAWWRVLLYPMLALLIYLHARLLEVRGGGWILIAIAAAAVPLGLIVSPEQPPGAFWESVSGLLSFAVVVVLPWLAARSRRQQAQLVRAGRREVEQLKREREHVSERARARERARIATDVHDSLGHELALIALRAGALELSPQLSEPNRRAARDLRSSAVKATDRLRETIGMLREDEVPTEPVDESVAELVDRAVAAGMDVTLTVDPPHPPFTADSSSTPPAIGETAEMPSHEVSGTSLTSDSSSLVTTPLAESATTPCDGTSTHPAETPAESLPPDRLDTRIPTATPFAATLPPVVDRAVHRVVREALTNAARHAPGASVAVRLRRNGSTLEVTVTNTTAVETPARPGAGSGLAGLAERVRLLNGEFSAGPTAHGFAVTARIPLGPKPTR